MSYVVFNTDALLNDGYWQNVRQRMAVVPQIPVLACYFKVQGYDMDKFLRELTAEETLAA